MAIPSPLSDSPDPPSPPPATPEKPRRAYAATAAPREYEGLTFPFSCSHCSRNIPSMGKPVEGLRLKEPWVEGLSQWTDMEFCSCYLGKTLVRLRDSTPYTPCDRCDHTGIPKLAQLRRFINDMDLILQYERSYD